MKRIVITLLTVFSCFNYFFGQVDRCSTDKMVQQELLLNPDKQVILNQLESFTQEFVKNYNAGRIVDTTYIIPVVVHVIHLNGPERIDMVQIESAIQSMNDDFNLLNDDLIDSNGDFLPSTTTNNIDTLSIFVPQSVNGSIDWMVQNNVSVKKNDTLCVVNNNNISTAIIADATNNYFSGGIINLLYDPQSIVESGDLIAQIITTEARGFEDIVADIGIEFRLATKDPQGNCTTGVTYHESSLTLAGGENVKDDTYWDNDMYLNIWTVANVASGAAAYAYYPGSAPTNHEGILCQHDYFGTTGTSSNNNWQRHTMSHEAGHYFNLPHPWGSTNDPSLETNCDTDDSVDDTPNTIGASGCYSYESQVSCGSLDNVANIMDYTNCAYMFSKGQRARMIAALNSNSGARNNLWSSENLELTGTNDAYYFSQPYADCIPVPAFTIEGDNFGSLGQNGFSVLFKNQTYNTVQGEVSYEWSFPGATPSTSSLQSPSVTYDVSGQHDVILKVSNNNGSVELVKENYITVLEKISSPLIEDFESVDFPSNAGLDKPNWYILDEFPTETNWKKNDFASFDGNQSIRIRSKDYSEGFDNVKQIIWLPEIDCSQASEGEDFKLCFNISYAKRLPYTDLYGNSVIPDTLWIQTRRNYGIWINRPNPYNPLTTDDLVSNQNTYFNNYVPIDSTDWKEICLDFNFARGSSSLMIKFEFQGKGYLQSDTLITTNVGGEYISNNLGGNWLYIDNVRIGSLQDIENRIDVTGESDELYNYRIFDLYGREYYEEHSLKNGIYFKNGQLVFIKGEL
ncbi:MAG: hypothetical protein CBD51_003675 [Flavobacteriales bacterium TMED191]|nr:MAG: hypothetical protein CBD51_003675 [Flavobacteriales bacterium TMED191]